jgi:hypothetical protein
MEAFCRRPQRTKIIRRRANEAKKPMGARLSERHDTNHSEDRQAPWRECCDAELS